MGPLCWKVIVRLAVTSTSIWLVPVEEKLIEAIVVLYGLRMEVCEEKVALAKVPLTPVVLGEGQSPVLTERLELVTL